MTTAQTIADLVNHARTSGRQAASGDLFSPSAAFKCWSRGNPIMINGILNLGVFFDVKYTFMRSFMNARTERHVSLPGTHKPPPQKGGTMTLKNQAPPLSSATLEQLLHRAAAESVSLTGHLCEATIASAERDNRPPDLLRQLIELSRTATELSQRTCDIALAIAGPPPETTIPPRFPSDEADLDRWGTQWWLNEEVVRVRREGDSMWWTYGGVYWYRAIPSDSWLGPALHPSRAG